MKEMLSIVAAALVLGGCGGGGGSHDGSQLDGSPQMSGEIEAVRASIRDIHNPRVFIRLPSGTIEGAKAADNHGWKGTKFSGLPVGEHVYEAVIYSNGKSGAASAYSSYGWWGRNAVAGPTLFSFATAFAEDIGDVPDAAGIRALRGMATYMGGAVGAATLDNLTAAGSLFTARVVMKADFNTDTISGAVDRFIGVDGTARDWRVELMESTIGDTGPISRTGTADGPGAETVWTIDGTAAHAAGEWRGSLQDNGGDGVPAVATGTFHSRYGSYGQMVGAFGADKQ